MYLHFEDWTNAPFVQQKLARLDVPVGERVIKVFSSDVNPRQTLGRTALTVIESDGSSFAETETYSYRARREYTGLELEEDLAVYGLGEVGNRTVRSLFRFSNLHGFCQAAMWAKKNRSVWRIRHPYRQIDGLDIAATNPARESTIHLDIIFPDSLKTLKNVVDYDDPEAILDFRGGSSLRKLVASK